LSQAAAEHHRDQKRDLMLSFPMKWVHFVVPCKAASLSEKPAAVVEGAGECPLCTRSAHSAGRFDNALEKHLISKATDWAV